MNAAEIHWHDSALLTVVEAPQSQLCFQLSYPVGWEQRRFSSKTIVFGGVHRYEIHEGSFEGQVFLLDATEEVIESGLRFIRIQTSCGYREITCHSLDLLDFHLFELAHHHMDEDDV